MASIPLASIKVPADHRAAAHLDDLMKSIETVGLLNPVIVDRAHNLLAGRRRLEACRALAWKSIPAKVVTLDALRRELIKLDNLCHAPLTTLQRAQQLARQQELYETINPLSRAVRVRGGPGRGNKTTAKVAPVFSAVAAMQLGASRRTAERVIEIGRKLCPKAAHLLRGHAVANSQSDLGQLIRLPFVDQRRVAKTLASGEARSVKGAVRALHWDNASKAPTSGKHYELHTGDFSNTLARIKPGTVDLLLTDPEWGRSFTRYAELGQGIARVLKPGGIAAIMIGQEFLPHVLDGFRDALVYRWTVAALRMNRQLQDWASGHMTGWLPVLIFTRGRTKVQRFESDVIGQHARKGTHGEYEKETEIPLELIRRYSHAGDVVVDPCCGLGSTGVAALRLARRFVGGDLDGKRVKATATRLAATSWADPALRPVDRSRGVPTPRWEESR
jgi:ubiquinone/menaquinone biosynthesis C-methylase UbiE